MDGKTMVLTSEGRAVKRINGQWNYEYDMKDYLRNGSKMKKRETSFNYKNKISLTVLLIAVAWFTFTVIKKGNINKNLYQNGEITNAIITNTKKVGGKGIIRCTYSFSFNGTKYEGWADNDYYKVGDTIHILFLKEKPEINRDKNFLEKIYR